MIPIRLRRLYMTLLLILTVLTGGRVQESRADDPAPPPPRPKVLIPVIGAQPKDGVEGSTEHAPDPASPNSPSDTSPNGAMGQGIGQRASELTEEGFDVEIRYFSSMQAYLCWLLAQAKKEPPPQYRHVEFYGHGSATGPLDGFTDGLSGPDLKRRWEWLGRLLRRIMTEGPGQHGHIGFGWCGGAAPGSGLPGGCFPGGVVAGKSGHPVYGGGGVVNYPFDSPPEPVGEPFSQPYPDGAHPPQNGEPGDTGWRRFPTGVPTEGGGMVPNGGTENPSPAPVPSPAAGQPRPGRLPKSPSEGGTDPQGGDNPPPAAPTPDDDGHPPGYTPPPPDPLPEASDIGC